MTSWDNFTEEQQERLVKIRDRVIEEMRGICGVGQEVLSEAWEDFRVFLTSLEFRNGGDCLTTKSVDALSGFRQKWLENARKCERDDARQRHGQQSDTRKYFDGDARTANPNKMGGRRYR